MTGDEFRDVMRLIFSAWASQRARMSPEDAKAMVLAYSVGLDDLDVALVRQAVTRLVRTSEWIPTVAAIRKAVGVVAHGSAPTGGEAWGDVMTAIRRYGSHRTPGIDFEFRDPIVTRIVRAFGWRDLCASDNPHADRARFIETYEQADQNERTEAQATSGGTSKVLLLRDEAEAMIDATRRALTARNEGES